MTPERLAEYWKMQAEASFQDNDLLSEGINQIYLALGLTEKFEVSHNPAHNQLEKILEKLKANG